MQGNIEGLMEIVVKKQQLFYIIMRFYNTYYSFMNIACKQYSEYLDTADVFISSNIVNIDNIAILPEEFLYHTSLRIGLLTQKEYYNIAFYVGYIIVSQIHTNEFDCELYISDIEKYDHHSMINASMFCSYSNAKYIRKFIKRNPDKYNALVFGYGFSIMRDAMLKVPNIKHIKNYINQYILLDAELISISKLFHHKQKQAEFIIRKVVYEVFNEQQWLFY